MQFEPANRFKERKIYTTSSDKKLRRVFLNRKGRGRNGMALLGATLPPADHRNQNARSPGENPSFLLGFREEDCTPWMRKLRRMPMRARERKEPSRRGPAKAPVDRGLLSSGPRNQGNTGKSGNPGNPELGGRQPWSNRKLSGEVCASHSFPICCLQRIDSVTAAALLCVPHFIITHKMVNVF